MISHKARPVIFGIRTLLILCLMKVQRSFDVKGWKYFFGEWGNFRVDSGVIKLKPGTWIESGTLIHVVTGEVSVGKRTFINRGCLITCRKKIHFGDDVLIGDHVSIYDHDHDFMSQDMGKPIGQNGYIVKEVYIGNNSWVGSHSVILKGVCIGEGCVIGAGSVVISNVPSGEIWAGVPAKKIR